MSAPAQPKYWYLILLSKEERRDERVGKIIVACAAAISDWLAFIECRVGGWASRWLPGIARGRRDQTSKQQETVTVLQQKKLTKKNFFHPSLATSLEILYLGTRVEIHKKLPTFLLLLLSGRPHLGRFLALSGTRKCHEIQ